MVNKENLGIQILRCILSFWVVLVHCSNIRIEHKNILIKKHLHVPTFIFISFFFFYKIIITRNISRLIQRYQRLFYPYIIWPLIFFFINNTIYIFFNYSQYKRKLGIRDLYIQLITGNGFHTIFWFHLNLIIISLFFTIISLIFKKEFMYVIHLLGFICFYLDYSGINYNFFINYKYEISHSLGTLIELIPISQIGFYSGSVNLISKLKIEKKYTILYILALYYFFKFNIFKRLFGIRYPHLMQNIFGTFIIFILFSSIGLENIANIFIIKLIKIFTNYTGGIYYLHIFIMLTLNKKFLFIKKKTYIGSLAIYIFCYFICFIGMIFLKKTKFKWLFF